MVSNCPPPQKKFLNFEKNRLIVPPLMKKIVCIAGVGAQKDRIRYLFSIKKRGLIYTEINHKKNSKNPKHTYKNLIIIK